MDRENKTLNRRKFIKQAAAGSAALWAASAFPTIVPSTVLGKNAPSNRIHIGQIGFGRIAMTHDLPEVMKHDYVRVIGVADVDSKRLAQGKAWIEKYYADKGGKSSVDVKTYNAYKDVLANTDLDAIM